MNSSRNLSSSKLSSTPLPSNCPGRIPMTILTVLIILTGLGGNVLVIRFARSDLRQRKTTDRFLLLNISMINLLGCCISLPLFYFEVEFLEKAELGNNVAFPLCLLEVFSLVFCLRTCHFMLAALCFDRYETITKGPQQKWITYKKARLITFTIYILVFMIVAAVNSGYVVTFFSENIQICSGLRGSSSGSKPSKGKTISRYAIIAETTLSISVANAICVRCLRKVDKYVNEHIESVRGTLGEQSKIKKLHLIRGAWAFVVAYSAAWIPFGISRVLKSVYPDSPYADCFYITSYTLSYSVFASIPILYIVTDKRIDVPLIRPLNAGQS